MTSLETIQEGITLTKKRLSDIPDYDIYQSILKQLNYISSVIDESDLDRSKLDKINVGHFAVREFEESDPELSRILKKCQNIAFKLDLK